MERYNQFIEACRGSLGVVLVDLVDGAVCACACTGDLVDVASRPADVAFSSDISSRPAGGG